MIKGVGALLIIAASLLLCRERFARQRQKLLYIEDLAQALSDMASAVRFSGLTIPDAMAQQQIRLWCGGLFTAASQGYEQGTALPESWQAAIDGLDWEVKRVLQTLSWQGDREKLLGELQRGAETLRETEARWREVMRSRRKVQLAGALSLGLLLMILLI